MSTFDYAAWAAPADARASRFMKVQLVGIITTAVALLSWGFCISVQRVKSVGRAIVVLDRGMVFVWERPSRIWVSRSAL